MKADFLNKCKLANWISCTNNLIVEYSLNFHLDVSVLNAIYTSIFFLNIETLLFSCQLNRVFSFGCLKKKKIHKLSGGKIFRKLFYLNFNYFLEKLIFLKVYNINFLVKIFLEFEFFLEKKFCYIEKFNFFNSLAWNIFSDNFFIDQTATEHCYCFFKSFDDLGKDLSGMNRMKLFYLNSDCYFSGGISKSIRIKKIKKFQLHNNLFNKKNYKVSFHEKMFRVFYFFIFKIKIKNTKSKNLFTDQVFSFIKNKLVNFIKIWTKIVLCFENILLVYFTNNGDYIYNCFNILYRLNFFFQKKKFNSFRHFEYFCNFRNIKNKNNHFFFTFYFYLKKKFITFLNFNRFVKKFRKKYLHLNQKNRSFILNLLQFISSDSVFYKKITEKIGKYNWKPFIFLQKKFQKLIDLNNDYFKNFIQLYFRQKLFYKIHGPRKKIEKKLKLYIKRDFNFFKNYLVCVILVVCLGFVFFEIKKKNKQHKKSLADNNAIRFLRAKIFIVKNLQTVYRKSYRKSKCICFKCIFYMIILKKIKSYKKIFYFFSLFIELLLFSKSYKKLICRQELAKLLNNCSTKNKKTLNFFKNSVLFNVSVYYKNQEKENYLIEFLNIYLSKLSEKYSFFFLSSKNKKKKLRRFFYFSNFCFLFENKKNFFKLRYMQKIRTKRLVFVYIYI